MTKIDESIFPAMSSPELGRILNRWREPHRRWHGMGHLAELLVSIEMDRGLDESDREMLRYVALFHDAIYSPLRGDNEEESAQLAVFYLRNYPRWDEVITTILSTKEHHSTDRLACKFNAWDCAILQEQRWAKLLAYEQGIAHEYAEVAPEMYRRERARFLEKAAVDFHNPLLVRLAKHVANERSVPEPEVAGV
jgi:predicted metal-dependent HD superfamily phosphohydrolase